MPHMHRTETIDYVIVIDGEIEMDMDDSTVKLKAGDILVQRGTNHAWANRSGKPARVAFVLVDGAAARHRQAGAGRGQRKVIKEEIHEQCSRISLSRLHWRVWPPLPARAGHRAIRTDRCRLIVPTSPGGVTDVMARIVAKGLTENLKETVIVDNRPGGNGSVGAIAVARSAPDGLNLLVTSDATITANPLLSSKLGYNAKEFTPIIVLCRGTPVLVINSKVPAKSVQGADRAGQIRARQAELRLLRRRHLRASQHGGLQAAHRHRHRAHPLSRRGAGGAGACWPATSTCCC